MLIRLESYFVFRRISSTYLDETSCNQVGLGWVPSKDIRELHARQILTVGGSTESRAAAFIQLDFQI